MRYKRRMAQITTLVCDVDGTTDNVTTVRFALQGKPYELDLSANSLKKLQEALAPFTAKARQAGSGTAAPKKRAASKSSGTLPDYDKEAFKTWAVDNDIALGRGRRDPELVKRFLAETAV